MCITRRGGCRDRAPAVADVGAGDVAAKAAAAQPGQAYAASSHLACQWRSAALGCGEGQHSGLDDAAARVRALDLPQVDAVLRGGQPRPWRGEDASCGSCGGALRCAGLPLTLSLSPLRYALPITCAWSA